MASRAGLPRKGGTAVHKLSSIALLAASLGVAPGLARAGGGAPERATLEEEQRLETESDPPRELGERPDDVEAALASGTDGDEAAEGGGRGRGDGSLRRAADGVLCAPDGTLTIGYEEGLPLGVSAANTRARRILTSAFCSNESGLSCDCELSYRSLHRGDVAASVAAGRVQVGLVGIPPAALLASEDEPRAVLASSQLLGVDSLPISPPSQAVVVRRAPEAEGGAAPNDLGPRPRVLDVGLSTPARLSLGVALGLLALALCMRAVNLQLPALSRLRHQPVRVVDPRLVRSTRVLRWMLLSASGRALSLVWAGLGAFGALLADAEQGPSMTQASLRATDYEMGALHAAYPGQNLYEFLDTRWRRCDEVHECFNNFARGEAMALAGDQDLLCYHAQESGIGELSLDSAVAPAPMLQVLLVPGGAAPSAQALRARLIDAMRREGEAPPRWGKCRAQGAALLSRK